MKSAIDLFRTLDVGERMPRAGLAKMLPPRAWGRIDDALKRAGLEEPVRLRIVGQLKAQVDAGRMAPAVLFLTQEFRNSETAETLAGVWNGSDASGRRKLEADVANVCPDPLVLGLLFTMGMKPFVFDPRENPANTATKVKHFETLPKVLQETFCSAKDASGRVVYAGTNVQHSRVTQADRSTLFDAHGRTIAHASYFRNLQCNFELRGLRTAEDVCKCYLGAKGNELFFRRLPADGRDVAVSFELTPGESRKLRSFFRWERNENTDAIIRAEDHRVKVRELHHALDDAIAGLAVKRIARGSHTLAEDVLATPFTRALLDRFSAQLNALTPESRVLYLRSWMSPSEGGIVFGGRCVLPVTDEVVAGRCRAELRTIEKR